MTHDEIMEGADVLNTYYRNAYENGVDRFNVTFVSAEEVIDSYEQLLSSYAEMGGCYCEFDERRNRGLEEWL